MITSKLVLIGLNAVGQCYKASKYLKSNHINKEMLTIKGYVRQSSTFKAAVLRENKENKLSLSIEDVNDRKLKKGEVKIKVKSCAVNIADLLLVRGMGQMKPSYPFTPGFEIAGEVVEKPKGGETKDDDSPEVGDRVVAYCRDTFGGFSTQCIVNEKDVWRVSTLDSKLAAALIEPYSLSLLALLRNGSVKEKNTILITVTAGGVGFAAVDIAANVYKAKVIGVCNTEDEATQLRERGAWSTLTFDKKKFRSAVNDIIGKNGVDHVFETVGGDVLKASLQCIKPEGKFIVASQGDSDVSLNDLISDQLPPFSLTCVSLRKYRNTLFSVYREIVSDALELCEQGLISPHIAETFSLENVNEALNFMEKNKSLSKVILNIGS